MLKQLKTRHLRRVLTLGAAAAAGVLPLLKQLLLFHVFVGDGLATVLWLYAVGAMAVPLVSLGGSDYLAQVVATRLPRWRFRLGEGSAAVTLVALVVSASLAGVLDLTRAKLPDYYFVGLFLYVFSMACFQHVSRLQRSFGRLDVMFGVTLLRQVIDFVLFVLVCVVLEYSSVFLVFLIEAGVTWGLLLLWPGLMARFVRVCNIRDAVGYAVFNRIANGFFGASLISVAAVHWYRVLAGFLLGSVQYSTLVLASLNQAVLMSGGAMVYSYIYAHLTRKWKDVLAARRFALSGVQVSIIAAVLFAPIQGVCAEWVAQRFAPGIPLSFFEAGLAAAAGWLYLFPVAEVFLTLKARSVALMKGNALNLLVSNLGIALTVAMYSVSVSAILLCTVMGRVAALVYMYWVIRRVQDPLIRH